MEVDPDRLRAIATTITETATTLSRALSSRTTVLAPAGGGWSAAGASGAAAAGSWDGLARRMGAAVGDFRADLITAADTYTETDQRAAAAMRAIREQVGRMLR